MADSRDLPADLDAFPGEHPRCDDLDADVDGPVRWMQCSHGVGLARPAHLADRVP